MSKNLKSFDTKDKLEPETRVWWANTAEPSGGFGGNLRLGSVIGQYDCYLIVQTGPDRFSDIVCAPIWNFYKYDGRD